MNYLEIIGCIVGIIYLWLEYKASIYFWPVSIIMPAIYIVVYYNAGLYADFGINIYFMLASIYGWIIWLRGRKISSESEVVEMPITNIDIRKLPVMLAVFLILFVFIAYILIEFTDSNVPWIDSFTTALSVIALWMLSRKYVEQWLVWVAVDVVSCGLYVYKSLYFTAALYLLYSVIAFAGYRKWKKMMYE